MATSFSNLYTELRSRLMDTSDAIWSLARKKEFINAAIRHANDMGACRVVVDETLTVTANAVEYTLPSGVPYADALFRVSVEGLASKPYTVKHSWTTTETRTYSAGVESKTLKLVLQEKFSEAAGKKIRLEYLAPHQELSLDTDETSLPLEYVLAYAMFLANQETRTGADVDRKYHLEEAQKYYQIAEAMLNRILADLPRVDGRAVVKVH